MCNLRYYALIMNKLIDFSYFVCYTIIKHFKAGGIVMKGKILTIGVDIGNYDTKTQRTSTPSGFTKNSMIPFSADECLFYNGYYYIADSLSRFPYAKDKTENENCFILSLFGIAKEILLTAKKDLENPTNEEIQEKINAITAINLGVGLPPTHCATLSKKLINYYREYFSDKVEFTYNNFNFSITLGACEVFAQDFSAVAAYKLKTKKENSIVKTFPTYYAIDIGGWTADIVSIVDGCPSIKGCDSPPLGVLCLYDNIISEIENSTGLRLSPKVIEDILLGRPTVHSSDIIETVEARSASWFELILQKLQQFGADFSSYPVVFIGGGCLLFKKNIEMSQTIKKYEIITDVHANAVGYEKLLKMSLRAKK